MNLRYFEDIPSAQPKFDYVLVAKALAPLLEERREGATVVGLHGPWGCGKTTLLGAVRRELASGILKNKAVFIDFNAWKFQDRQALWRALILHIVGELRRFGASSKGGQQIDAEKLEELEQSLYLAFSVEEKGPWSVNWRSLVTEVVSLLLSLVHLDFVGDALRKSTGFLGRLFFSRKDDDPKADKESALDAERIEKLAGVLERKTVERQVVQVQSIEQFLGKFRELMTSLARNDRRVFVFIDDLDRCLPESALEIFESIKLFLDASNCGYVVALDRETIRKGLALRYGRQGLADQGQALIDPDEYIEKTISVSFDLPRLSSTDAAILLNDFQLPVALDESHRQQILAALGINPRRIKRFMNTLAVQLHLAALAKEANLPIDECLLNGGQSDNFKYFLKLLLLAYRYSGVVALAGEDADLLGRLQAASNTYEAEKTNNIATARVNRKIALDRELPLVASLQDKEQFWQLMAIAPNLRDAPEVAKRLLHWFRPVASEV
jgi:hypothetical protein